MNFLREHGLSEQSIRPELCHQCSSDMQEKFKRDKGEERRLVLRCLQKVCHVTRSVQQGIFLLLRYKSKDQFQSDSMQNPEASAVFCPGWILLLDLPLWMLLLDLQTSQKIPSLTSLICTVEYAASL